MNDLTLAIVLTAAGATVAAGLVSGVTELLKGVLPVIARRGLERATAFVLSALLVAAAFVDAVGRGALAGDLAGVFGALVAWYGIARLALATYDDVRGRVNSLTGPTQ